VAAATELLAAAKKFPPNVYLVIGCPTPTEWNDHLAEAIADCDAAVASVDSVAQAWGFLGIAGIPPLPMYAQSLSDRLKDLSQELLHAAILLDKDSDALSRAIDRVINSTLPAKKGGKGAKDSVILEHAIALADALRSAGLGETCIFVSSNTRDFSAPGSTALHPLLQPDFDPPTDLLFAVSLPVAVARLKAVGWVP
jgi:hypothetical protein